MKQHQLTNLSRTCHCYPLKCPRNTDHSHRFPSLNSVAPRHSSRAVFSPRASLKKNLVAAERSEAALGPFVSIRGSKSPLRFLRVFASSREAHVSQTCSSKRQSAVSRWQRADLGLESPSYIHSWPFVVRRYPCVSLRVFASSRELHSPQTCSSQRQSAGSRSQRADLGLESPSYIQSCPFVFHCCCGLRLYGAGRRCRGTDE